MTTKTTDIRLALRIDPAVEAVRLEERLRSLVAVELRRRGAVVAMSGGVDSSVCAAIAARALGPDRVLGLLLPEREGDPADTELARDWAERLRIAWLVEDISAVLERIGCYQRRDDAIRRVVPEYGDEWRCKIGLRPIVGGLNVFHLTARSPSGAARELRLPPGAYREIVAATNFKQRIRKVLEYHHADRLHYAVLGTPNRLEYDQGFFVKGGDGLADVKPIAHLYKTQVYALAEHFGVPKAILDRPPSTGTYSLPQTQGEFYFALEPRQLDVVLYALNAGLAPSEPARELGLTVEQVTQVYRDIARKRATTRYQQLPPLLADAVPEIS